MFEVGDYIIYGNNGVCKITNVGPMDMPGVPKSKLYYTMTPCYIRDSSIFTPVDNDRVVMRKVMSRQEAEKFLETAEDIDKLDIKEEKQREQEYKAAILTCDPTVLVGIIKTIQDRMQDRIAEGKKVTASDTKYIHIAEDSLYGELAISFDMEKDDVKAYVKDRIDI